MKAAIKLFPAFFLLLLYSSRSYGQAQQGRQMGQSTASDRKKTAENMYHTDGEDTAMNRAMATAKARFGRFDSAFLSGRYDKKLFSIKVKFRNPEGNEYIWLTDIHIRDHHYWGLLSDTPATKIPFKLGDQVLITKDAIADWMYGKDSVMHGAYTLRVILSRETEEEKQKDKQDFPYKIED